MQMALHPHFVLLDQTGFAEHAAKIFAARVASYIEYKE